MKFRITISTFLVISVFTLVLFGLACSKKNNMTGEEPVEAQKILEKLNDWDKTELDIFEKPDKYPDRIVSGQTKGWVETHKEDLKKLGFTVIWNSDKKVYEFEQTAGKE